MSSSQRYFFSSVWHYFKPYAWYFVAFVAIVVFLFVGSRGTTANSSSDSLIISYAGNNDFAVSMDQISESFLISQFTSSMSLPSSDIVSDNFTSLSIIYDLTKSSDAKLARPNIIDTSGLTHEIAVEYTFKEGDTLQAIADKYGVTTTNIRWSNNLKNNNVSVGKVLYIPTRPGILYTVKSGDSIDGIVSKYKTNKDEVIAFNDFDVKEFKAGITILLPSGELPEKEQPEYVAPTTAPSYNYSRNTSNTYSYGWCTWYAADWRSSHGAAIPNSWGNATTWLDRAAAMGWQVSRSSSGASVPKVGAIMHNYAFGSGANRFGHVAIVESVNPGVSVTVSEMNWVGWGIRSTRTVDWNRATTYYNYIY